jgi:hypothetical protein
LVSDSRQKQLLCSSFWGRNLFAYCSPRRLLSLRCCVGQAGARQITLSFGQKPPILSEPAKKKAKKKRSAPGPDTSDDVHDSGGPTPSPAKKPKTTRAPTKTKARSSKKKTKKKAPLKEKTKVVAVAQKASDLTVVDCVAVSPTTTAKKLMPTAAAASPAPTTSQKVVFADSGSAQLLAGPSTSKIERAVAVNPTKTNLCNQASDANPIISVARGDSRRVSGMLPHGGVAVAGGGGELNGRGDGEHAADEVDAEDGEESDDVDDDDDDDDESNYELMRHKRIEENNRMLASLGLGGSSMMEERRPNPKPKPRPVTHWRMPRCTSISSRSLKSH